MKRNFRILSILVLSALLLTACGSQAAPAEVMEEPAQPTAEVMEDDQAQEAMEEDEMMEDEETMEEEEAMEDGDMMEEDDMAEDEEMMDEEMMGEITTFTVRIENTSPAEGLTVLAPGAFEINDHPVSFFTAGEPDRGQGLEALAEDGVPGKLVESINQMMADMDDGMESEMEAGVMAFQSGVFNTPVGAEEPGPAGPGAAYEFTFEAYPGQYLTFATMFVQSNDWFFAPDEMGIALFSEEGEPVSGEITGQVYLWDSGTEVDQTPGEGADQPPRQSGMDTGQAENGVVERVDDFKDFQIEVSITPQ